MPSESIKLIAESINWAHKATSTVTLVFKKMVRPCRCPFIQGWFFGHRKKTRTTFGSKFSELAGSPGFDQPKLIYGKERVLQALTSTPPANKSNLCSIWDDSSTASCRHFPRTRSSALWQTRKINSTRKSQWPQECLVHWSIDTWSRQYNCTGVPI